jgi:outer membrane receptor protein involved in Fe transport
VNFIYSVSSKQNIRVSFSKTLNRPEFRELAPFAFYDFDDGYLKQGNPNLKIASVQNFDLRYEVYPGKGQMFTVSYFSKKFTNPIEIIQQINNKTITYENANSAKNSGFEFEFRTLLSSLIGGENSAILDDVTLFSNIAIIRSKVDVSNVSDANPEKSRPLQGQSPYVLNAGAQYINKDNGWAVSMNVNRVGNRIVFGSSEVEPSLWEKARTFLDLQIAKNLYKNKIEVKLNVQNILAQDLVFYQNKKVENPNLGNTLSNLTNLLFTSDPLNENGFNSKVDDVAWRIKNGRTFSLAFTYNF